MKNYILIVFFSLLFSCSVKQSYAPDNYLIEDQQKKVVASIIRHISKLPKGATHETKFHNKFDSYYEEQTKLYTIQQYYISPEKREYFLISRPAPSLKEKKVAIGGYLIWDKNGNLNQYEEVFRTWKMDIKTLEEKGNLLFSEMVEGKDLTAYQPQHSKEEYIEFPDQRTYFDRESLSWKTKS